MRGFFIQVEETRTTHHRNILLCPKSRIRKRKLGSGICRVALEFVFQEWPTPQRGGGGRKLQSVKGNRIADSNTHIPRITAIDVAENKTQKAFLIFSLFVSAFLRCITRSKQRSNPQNLSNSIRPFYPVCVCMLRSLWKAERGDRKAVGWTSR